MENQLAAAFRGTGKHEGEKNWRFIYFRIRIAMPSWPIQTIIMLYVIKDIFAELEKIADRIWRGYGNDFKDEKHWNAEATDSNFIIHCSSLFISTYIKHHKTLHSFPALSFLIASADFLSRFYPKLDLGLQRLKCSKIYYYTLPSTASRSAVDTCSVSAKRFAFIRLRLDRFRGVQLRTVSLNFVDVVSSP